MPQFLEEITSVRLSLVCCLKMNWWAFKTQAVFSNLLTGGNVFPKEFMMQPVLMDDSQEPVDPVGVWSRGFSLPKSHCLFQKHGVNAVLQERQAYPHGSRHGSSRRILFIAGLQAIIWRAVKIQPFTFENYLWNSALSIFLITFDTMRRR